MPARATANLKPSTTQTIVLAGMGAFYWFVAALVVRWTAANWVGNTAMTLLVFAAIVVVTGPALLIGMKIASVRRSDAAFAATIMTMTALFFDGIAITWFGSLYGIDPATVLGGAASIMFGAGVALALGMVLQRD